MYFALCIRSNSQEIHRRNKFWCRMKKIEKKWRASIMSQLDFDLTTWSKLWSYNIATWIIYERRERAEGAHWNFGCLSVLTRYSMGKSIHTVTLFLTTPKTLSFSTGITCLSELPCDLWRQTGRLVRKRRRSKIDLNLHTPASHGRPESRSM